MKCGKKRAKIVILHMVLIHFCWTFTIVEQLRTFSEQTPTFLFAHDLLLLLKITANIRILLTYSSSCTDGMGNH